MMVDQQKVRYLILESRSAQELMKSLYGHESDPEWDYLFSNTEWAPYREHGPLIVKAPQGSELYQWALAELKKSVDLIGVIIESDAGLQQLADWWRERLTVKLDSVRTALLRLYDPVIWHGLQPRDTGNPQPIERVIYWSGDAVNGRWCMSYNPEPVTMTEPPTLEMVQKKTLGLISA